MPGQFQIRSYTADGEKAGDLIGDATAETLTWQGQNLVRSVDGVKADAAGNVALNALPKSGGTMTGGLRFSAGDILGSTNTLAIGLYGGVDYANGSGFIAYGKDHANSRGAFVASAHDGTTNKTLVGRPNGTLIWAGKDITLGYPNYAAGVSIGSVTSYTATGDGWVRVYVHGDNQVCTFQVNGVSTHTFGGTQHDHATLFIPVKKGDVVKFVRSEGTLVKTSWVFYPNR